MIKQFLDTLRTQRYSEATIRAYRRILEGFLIFLDTRAINPKNPARTQIQEYLSQYKKLSARTVAQKLAAIKSFYNYLVSTEAIASNPAQGIKAPKIETVPPVVLTQPQVSGIFQNHFNSPRDRLILTLLYYLGLRIGELARLNIQDINLEANTVRIHGKGNKIRILPLCGNLPKLLANYIGNRKTGPIFVNQHGHRLSTRWMRVLVHQYAHTNPHTLRHSFATHMHQGGASLRAVQLWLGHASILTTQGYTQLNLQDLERAYLIAHLGEPKRVDNRRENTTINAKEASCRKYQN